MMLELQDLHSVAMSNQSSSKMTSSETSSDIAPAAKSNTSTLTAKSMKRQGRNCNHDSRMIRE